MTLYMPPMATKKRETLGENTSKSNMDTKRVFGNYEDNLPTAQTHYNSINNNTLVNSRFSPAKSRVLSPARQHNPHPSQVGFLLQDCRLLHEPICDVKPQDKTAVEVDPEGDKWWKWRAGNDDDKKTRAAPKYSYNSTSRDQYRTPDNSQAGQTRHGSNPSAFMKGIVPITSIPSEKGPRLLVEHISYQHQYNSRTNPSQPIRGKQHGTFVWDCFHPVSPPKSTTRTGNKTTIFTTPWAPTTQGDDNAGKATSSVASSPGEGNVRFQEVVDLGTNSSTLPPVAS